MGDSVVWGVSLLSHLIVTPRKRTITAWSAGTSSRLASNHGLHGFFIRISNIVHNDLLPDHRSNLPLSVDRNQALGASDVLCSTQ